MQIEAKESTWTHLFGQHYMGMDLDDSGIESVSESDNKHADTDDDMLFYVSRQLGDLKQELSVFRQNAKNLPGLGDPHIDWEESVYLNLILHDLEYVITCAVCCRLPSQDLKVLRKQTLDIHASPHMRRMDSKGDGSALSYPNIFFSIDSFDEVFRSLCVQEDEIVCVELVAKYKTPSGTQNCVVFLGSVKYESLLRVYENKSTFKSRFAQKASLQWLTGSVDRVEFIRMRGPHGKGYAEMAVSQYKDQFIENNAERPENRYQSSKGKFNASDCQCPINIQQQNVIYNPTTTETCSNCNNADENGEAGTIWTSTMKWLHEKKKGSQVLSSHLTYVTLPWSSIMRDIFYNQQKPIFFKDPNRERNGSSTR